MSGETVRRWVPGDTPIAVIMLSLNEEHHMAGVLDNLKGFAHEVFLVDSFSEDHTIDIALEYGVTVVQRAFQGFGDQWNFALNNLPITAPFTMKLDPDERISDALKGQIRSTVRKNSHWDGARVNWSLFFMGRPLHVKQKILRVWRTGSCRFSDVLVNEHPIVEGEIIELTGDLEHHDSANLHRWYDKQNKYTTNEAIISYRGGALSADPKILGNKLERRMWIKKRLMSLPFRSPLIFLYCVFVKGAWRAGRVGLAWAELRTHVYTMWYMKLLEMRMRKEEVQAVKVVAGKPHPGALQR